MFPALMGKKKAPMVLGMHEEPKEPEAGERDALKAIARDLIEAVKSGSEDRVASALYAAWAECEAHEEGE